MCGCWFLERALVPWSCACATSSILRPIMEFLEEQTDDDDMVLTATSFFLIILYGNMKLETLPPPLHDIGDLTHLSGHPVLYRIPGQQKIGRVTESVRLVCFAMRRWSTTRSPMGVSLISLPALWLHGDSDVTDPRVHWRHIQVLRLHDVLFRIDYL